MIVLSHPTGNANARNAIRGLQDAGLLASFLTSVATFDGNLYDRLSRLPGFQEFNRRRFDAGLQSKTRQKPYRELLRLLSTRAGLSALISHETGLFCVDAVYRSIDRFTAKRLARQAHAKSGSFTSLKRQNCPPLPSALLSAVYAYEDGALETFRTAKSLGLRTIYDLPIGYWRAARKIQTEEGQRFPEWASTMPALIDSEAKVERKDEELKLADQIIVASSFTAATLQEAPFALSEAIVIPYGCPEIRGNDDVKTTCQSDRRSPLKVLFVGGLSQRKGLTYLFEAADQLGSAIELTIIGRKPAAECKPLESALTKHRWIPSVSHERILEEMSRHDVFVFPSLFEGFGLVITEALSQGLPVITTPHTCGPDILTNGEDGFIVPIRDSQSIAGKLEQLHRDRTLLASMSAAARQTAQRNTWSQYRTRLTEAVRSTIETKLS